MLEYHLAHSKCSINIILAAEAIAVVLFTEETLHLMAFVLTAHLLTQGLTLSFQQFSAQESLYLEGSMKEHWPTSVPLPSPGL